MVRQLFQWLRLRRAQDLESHSLGTLSKRGVASLSCCNLWHVDSADLRPVEQHEVDMVQRQVSSGRVAKRAAVGGTA